MTHLLRDYQEEAIREAHRHLYVRGVGGTIIHFATGLGKTRTAAEFIVRNFDLHKQRVMFVVHTIDLVLQTYFAFLELHPEWSQRCYTKFGFPGIGIVMGKYNQSSARIIIGTPQTLSGTESSSERLEEVLKYGTFDLIILDEAHYGASQSYLNLCEAVLPAKRLGLTATPMRSDGLALRQPIGATKEVLFDTICISRNIKWGIANGYLCPIANEGKPLLVETNIALPEGRGGLEERAKLIDVNNWAELVVDAYELHGGGRLSVYFLPSVEHSRKVWEEFTDRGIKAVHVEAEEIIFPDGTSYTGQKSKDMRKVAYNLAYTGEVDVFCNYGILTHGWDMPPISLVGLARPTDSFPLVAQMVGRGTRLYEDKENLLVIDYTLKDITLLLSGTLSGYTWNEKRKEIVEDTEAEVEVLSDGIDLRDLEEDLVDGKGIITRVGTLFRSMSQAWYKGSDGMSLGLSEDHMLFITLPNHTQANNVSDGIRIGQDFLLEHPDHEQGKEFYQSLLHIHKLLSSYALWHLELNSNGIFSIEFVALSDSPELVFDYALPLIEAHEDPRLAKKHKTWRKEKITDKQLYKLKRYGILDLVYDKGTASQIISHHIASKNVMKVYKNILAKAGKYVNYT